ncbi:MAG: T9SS type A sorting domain-containing protein [Bacteroidota bacterium]
MKIRLFLLVIYSLISLQGQSQWNIDPSINTQVSVGSHNQSNCYIVTDGKKGAIMVWEDHRNDSTYSDIYSQRLNAEGYPIWTANGIPICTDTLSQKNEVIIDAGNGSAIIAWQDDRNGNADIYAQKVDSSGNLLWALNGVGVCTTSNNQRKPALTSDMNGGAIIAWEDSSSTSNVDIYANRIDANGILKWGSGGVSICSAINKQSNIKVRQDTKGGAIIGWQDFRNGLEYYVYAQRVDSTGALLWIANGVKVCPTGGGQTNPKLREDGQGGVYVGWQDKRSGGYDAYAQRLSASGTLLWNSLGVAVCNYLGNQSALDMSTEGINGAIISWKDNRTGIVQVYANKISPSGVLQWGTYGMLIATGINPNTVGDESGGVIITWQDSVNSGGTWNVYAQRIDSLGTKLWLNTGAPVATANGGQSSPKQVSTGDGGAIFCWQDKRSTTDLDVYAHHLFPSGLSYIETIEEYKKDKIIIACSPNPFQSDATISINSLDKIKTWTINVFDNTGQLVFTEIMNNTSSSKIDGNVLANGIYLYQAINNSEIIGSGKFVITK